MNEKLKNSETMGMPVNEEIKSELLQSAKWMKYICIINCIEIVMMLTSPKLFMSKDDESFIGVLIFLIIIALFFIFPLVRAFQFVYATKKACLTDNEEELARGLARLHSCVRFIGIVSIILAVICTPFLLSSYMGAMMMGAGGLGG